MDDPSALVSLWVPAFYAAGIGWTLHRQGRSYLDSAYYFEVEARLNSCWILDAMIADAGQTIAIVHLNRPSGARPFTVVDVEKLDRLRPWLAHAFRQPRPGAERREDCDLPSVAWAPVLSGQMMVTPDRKVVFQTASLEHLLRIIEGRPINYTSYAPCRDGLPSPVSKLIQRIAGAANGTSNAPPCMQIRSAYGVLTLEAKWLMPVGAVPEDVARDPKSCLISVTLELREHAVAHAARILRESGATPTQVRVGIGLALGKTKPMIAHELGIKLSPVADQTKRLPDYA